MLSYFLYQFLILDWSFIYFWSCTCSLFPIIIKSQAIFQMKNAITPAMLFKILEAEKQNSSDFI